MAKQNFPPNIYRRLLMSGAAAAVTTTGIMPGVKPADAAPGVSDL